MASKDSLMYTLRKTWEGFDNSILQLLPRAACKILAPNQTPLVERLNPCPPYLSSPSSTFSLVSV